MPMISKLLLGLCFAIVGSVAGAQTLSGVPERGPIPESAAQSTGYISVAAALSALHAKPGVTFKTEGGWLVATDPSPMTLWSFPPLGHPAYPSAVKRELVNEGGGANLHMSIRCEAAKQACDDLVRTFERLNQQMIQSIRSRR